MDANQNNSPSSHRRIARGPGSGRHARVIALTAAVACLATPVATWWLVGDLTEGNGADLTYTVEPLSLSPTVELSIGLVATLLAVVTAAALVWWSARRRFDPRWWGTIVPLLFVGVVAGFGWRLLTAGSIGANIGAGLFLLYGVPAMLVMVAWAVIWSVVVRRSTRTRSGSTDSETDSH